MSIKPKSKPQRPDHEVRARVQNAGYTDKLFLVAFRGYYRDSMGVPGKNDRGIYDDAVFLVTPKELHRWNFNVDPSTARDGIANLIPGRWLYKVGIHGLSKPKAQQYKAFVQASVVTVKRDGRGLDTGWFGINIHRGGVNGTSSLGCQTVPPDQWDNFFKTVTSAMAEANVLTIPYILLSDE